MYSFDGVNDFVNIPFKSLFNVSHFSILAFIRTTSSGIQNIVDRDDSFSQRIFQFRLNAVGKLDFIPFFAGSPLTTVTSGAIINDGKNHCVGVTYDKVNIKLYIDGSNAYTVAETRAMDTSGTKTILIGATAAGAQQNFNGIINEVIFCSTSLTAYDVNQISNSGVKGTAIQAVVPGSLVFYMPLDEFANGVAASGTDATRDRGPNGLNGTPTNSPTGSPENMLSYM